MKSVKVSTEIVVFQFFRIDQLKLKKNLLYKNVIYSFFFENLLYKKIFFLRIIFEKLLYTHYFLSFF